MNDKLRLPIPKGAKMQLVWNEYLTKLSIMNQLMELLQDGSIDDHMKCRYALNLLDMNSSKHTVFGGIPLADYCRMTKTKYETVAQRMYAKMMTAQEAIEYGFIKQQRKEERERNAKHRKQRKHMLAIIDNLANQVVDTDSEESGENREGAGI